MDRLSASGPIPIGIATRRPDERRAGPSRFVPVATHREVVEELVAAVGRGEPLVRLIGAEGSGRSTLLKRALAELRGPKTRIALAEGPDPLPQWLHALGGSRHHPRAAHDPRRTLAEAIRIVLLESDRIILALDPATDGLGSLPEGRGRVCVLTVESIERPGFDESAWTIRVPALTRAEVGEFLRARLDATGREHYEFTSNLTTLPSCSHRRTSGSDRSPDRPLIGPVPRSGAGLPRRGGPGGFGEAPAWIPSDRLRPADRMGIVSVIRLGRSRSRRIVGPILGCRCDPARVRERPCPLTRPNPEPTLPQRRRSDRLTRRSPATRSGSEAAAIRS